MVVVCKDFDQRLDSAWYKIQQAISERYSGQGLSQYDLDEECILVLEEFAQDLTEKVENCKYDT